MLPVRVLVTRDVPADEEHNDAGRDINQGEVLYLFRLCTYDSVDVYHGIALSEQPDEYPFFEFPNDAIEAIE